MASSPSSGSTPAASKATTRQACDGCRLRKRKCTFKGDDSVHWVKPAQARCQNCDRANTQCTFLLPLRTRGPKPRAGRHKTSLQFVSSDQNLNWQGDLLDVQSQGSPSPQFIPNASRANERTAFDTDVSVHSASPSMQDSLQGHATDVLFHRDLVRFILQDYITYVYPLIPVIHIPTFQTKFSQEHDAQNQDFLALIISMCALTVGLLPSRFWAYREYRSPLPFKTRTEMANHCYKLNQGLRDIEYWDTVSHQKWASSYLLALTFHQTGNVNLWRMLEVESIQLLRLLEVQHASSYSGLDFIETQLRKKAFWLMFYAYVHHTHSYRQERVTFLDPIIMRDIKLEELMPAPVDDEYISSTGILPCPEGIVVKSLTSGFNIHSRIFSAGQAQTLLCRCAPTNDSEVRLSLLTEQLHHIQRMLDTVEPTYRPRSGMTSTPRLTGEDDPLKNTQREVIRANIETTHLWLQVVLLDEIDTILSEQRGHASSPEGLVTHIAPGLSFPTSESLWDERERVCREFLYTMRSFAHSALEPNGNALVYKLRDAAVALLAYPDHALGEQAERIQAYLGEFSELLSILDVSEMVNTLSLQSWIDTSKSQSVDQEQ
ncbi:hypothetical protein NW768_002299 [Fusarium equiseti]|uniref:Zn(2)-C6 fungal-type domain-containing protein n=1 Tax=Fusarium equiseti TaxID=61235 RepID=A0ABQ8RN70_FUSEQ|nr:hypothetical protein NW768_002299 [Fusarium equiseti]